MAAILRKMCLLEIFDDNEEDFLVQLASRSKNTAFLQVLLRREYVPKVENYMTEIVGQMDIPEHIDDFKTHFRVSRDVFHIVLENISDSLIRAGIGPHQTVHREKQLLDCLSYLATSQSMRKTAHIFCLSKSTVHQIVKDVCAVLAQLCTRIIRWLPPERQLEIASEIEEVCSLPGVIGFIYGSHIRLSAALEGEQDYYSRKGYPSLQLQIVVDNNMKILNAYTGWPGCVHDARVLRNSSLFTKAEAGESHLRRQRLHTVQLPNHSFQEFW